MRCPSIHAGALALVLLSRAAAQAPQASSLAPPEASAITVPEGFVVERLYVVPPEQGTWVALAFLSDDTAVASDGEGSLYHVVFGTTPLAPRVTRLALPIGDVKGLCASSLRIRDGKIWWDLGAVVSGSTRFQNGLYRIIDSDEDGELDRVECLRVFEGAGARGLRSVTLGLEPALYVHGDGSLAPPAEALAKWGSSWLSVGRLPVAVQTLEGSAGSGSGWVARTDLDGKEWELVAVGLGPESSFAFLHPEEPVVLEAGSEDERGLPWYAPPRLSLLHERADFGFRPGSARWPRSLPDVADGTVEVGPMPAGAMVSGMQLGFPEPYVWGLFAADERGGRIVVVLDLRKGGPPRTEVFASGRPFPVTAFASGDQKGMHLLAGGAGSASALYRIRWQGPPASTGGAGSYMAPGAGFRSARKRFLDGDWSALAVREVPGPYRPEVRMALESVPLERWGDVVASESDPEVRAALELAWARVAPPERVRELLERLAARPFLVEEDRERPGAALAAARTLELALLRAAPLEAATRARLAETLLAAFPSGDGALDRELGVLLASLPEAAERFVLLAVERCVRAVDGAEAFHWAFLLRGAEAGWTIAARRKLFNWLYGAQLTLDGGRAVPLWLAALREDLLANLPAEARAELGPLVEPPPELAGGYASARPFVRAWTRAELEPRLGELGAGRDLARGRRLLEEACCLACHRVEGRGGGGDWRRSGPALTGLAGRYAPEELLAKLLEPSRAVPDAERDTIVTLHDGRRRVGRVVAGDEGVLALRERYGPGGVQRLAREDIEALEPAPLSPMPAGLLDSLAAEEILDLLAWLLQAE